MTKTNQVRDRKPGRPAEAKNRDYRQADAPASRCPKEGCGSTDRTPYETKTIVRVMGNDPKSGPYNVVVLRPTCCKRCGQWRRDRTLLNTDTEVTDAEIAEIVDAA